MNCHARRLIELLVKSPDSPDCVWFDMAVDSRLSEIAATLWELRHREAVGTALGTPVFTATVDGIVIYFCGSSERIHFLIALIDQVIPGLGNASAEVGLYRGPPVIESLPHAVFWEVVQPRSGIVVSDAMNRKWQEGGVFWRDRIVESFARPGVSAGIVDDATGEIWPICNPKDLSDQGFRARSSGTINHRFFIQQQRPALTTT
jgi:hypothetical protein